MNHGAEHFNANLNDACFLPQAWHATHRRSQDTSTVLSFTQEDMRQKN